MRGIILIALLIVTVAKTSLEFADDNKVQMKIGAIFFKDEDDIELCFDEAFHQINSNKLFEVLFVPIKRFLATDDSYILQQITCELIADGVTAIFGPSSKASSDIVASMANVTGLPHIEYDWLINRPTQLQKTYRMTVNVAPSQMIVSQAYFDIVKTDFNWRTFTIIYENDKSLERLQDLMDIQPIGKELIKLRKISDYEDDIRVLWKEMSETIREPRIILDCPPEMLESLFQSALPFNLFGSFRSWFVTHLDTHSSTLKDIYNEAFRSNITSVRLKIAERNPYERRKTKMRPIDELLENGTLDPILIYDAVVLYANAAKSVVVAMSEFSNPELQCAGGFVRNGPWEFGPAIVKEMKTITEDDVEPKFRTEKLRINEYGQRTEFALEIYKPTVNEPMALWNIDRNIETIRQRPLYEVVTSPQDFSQARKLYVVAVRYEEPYFMLKENHLEFRDIEKYQGYAVDLIQKLSELLEFEYTFTICSGNGKYDPQTKQWDGIIRKLQTHEAQIGICDLTITQSRREVVDFTVPFMQLGISILGYKTRPNPPDPFAFLDPFAKDVWYYMLLTQLVMTISLVFIARISDREWQSPQPYDTDPEEIENIWNIMNSFWLMIGSIMQQGCDMLPRGPPMRILTGMWWFFALMMLSTYTANLAAFLTNSKLQSTINDLSDLIDQDKVQYGTILYGSTYQSFSESNHSDYQRAWNQMKSFKPSAFTLNNQEGVERVKKEEGKYAFLMETTSLSYNIERNCSLKEIGSPIGEKHYGLAVPLGAEYRTNLSVAILQLSEKGELYKLKDKWWTRHNVTCEDIQEEGGEEFSIEEVGGVFVVLGYGLAAAAIFAICEFLWNIRRVAVREKVTPGQAFKAEFLFFIKFWKSRKPISITNPVKNPNRKHQCGHQKLNAKDDSTKRLSE